MPPIARITVLLLPEISHANPIRGSTSMARVVRYPRGVLGSVPIARPLFLSPAPGTNERTYREGKSCAGVGTPPPAMTRGSTARWLAVAHAVPSGGTPPG